MSLLEQVAIFLATAVFLVPLFRRLKLGAVLGYLAAGALIYGAIGALLGWLIDRAGEGSKSLFQEH